MSVEAGDTGAELVQFLQAYEGDWVSREGQLVIDHPEVRRRLIEAIDRYTAIYRHGCTPPASTSWASIDNNKAFLAQTVVMTPNESLSIPNALKRERPEITTRTPQRSDGHSAHTATRFRSKAASMLRAGGRRGDRPDQEVLSE